MKAFVYVDYKDAQVFTSYSGRCLYDLIYVHLCKPKYFGAERVIIDLYSSGTTGLHSINCPVDDLPLYEYLFVTL